MIRMNPYLAFGGRCRDAMTFYREVLGGELTLQTVAESPLAARCPEGMHDQIMHSVLAGDGFLLMGTDMTRPGETNGSGAGMAVALDFDDGDETGRCFAALADGGAVVDPLERRPWGALFGVVQDRFGKVWMLSHRTEEPS